MHSALFIASIPEDRRWGPFLSFVDAKIKNDPHVRRLAENVWLVCVKESVAGLGWLVSIAESQTVSYGLLPFDDAPQWLPAAFDPKTIRDQSGRSMW